MIDLLGLLVGKWEGKGFGQYPTIASFEYLETLRFTLHEARPLLGYVQNTRRFDGEAQSLGQRVIGPEHRLDMEIAENEVGLLFRFHGNWKWPTGRSCGYKYQ